MPLNPIPAAGPPGWVVAAFQFAVGRSDRSSVVDAQIRAANQAGYTRAAGYSVAQQTAVGQGIRSADAFALGQGGGPGARGTATPTGPPNRMPVPQPPPFYPPVVFQPPPQPGSPPPSPQPQPSGGGSGGGGTTSGPWRPGAPGGPDTPVPVPVVGVSWPWIAASVLGPYVVPAVIRGGELARDWILQGRPLPKGPKTRRRRSPHRGPGPKRGEEMYGNREMGNPFPAKGPDAQRPERIPRAERVATILAQLGGDIYVDKRRLRVPKAPRPSPPPPTPPAKVPLWLTLLPIVGPGIFSALMPAQGNRTVVRLTDPLTRPSIDNGNPFPLTQPQTLVQSFGAFGGSPGAVGTNTCECKAPRKKGRKKKRTVCYSGTFIERRDGTRKIKKRKVQCL